MAVLQSNHLIEFSSVSGVVYVSIDQQLYRQNFKKHIKVWVIMDDELSLDQPSCCGPIQKKNELLENCVEDSFSVHFGSLSSDVPSEDSPQNFTELAAFKNDVKINSFGMENPCDEEAAQKPKQKVLNQKHKGLKACKRKKEKIYNFNVMKSSARKKQIRESVFINTKDKCTENNPCPQPAEFDGEKSEVKRLDIQKDVFCEYCSKSFKSREEFYNHRKLGFIEHSCDICHKVFPYKAHLIVHMGVHENRRTAIDSEEFDYLVRDDSQLKSSRHSSSQDVLVKSSETSLTCEVCNLHMSSRSVLKTHMMKHTGEKAYKCCVCSKQFNSIGRFTHHMTTHRKCGKVQCKLCNIGFENRSELSKHQLTHEYKCSLCGAVFPNKTSRVFHYRLSHKEDILRCPECDKLYSSDSELKLHLKYHQNRSKTQCTICGCFVSRLSNHLLSHSSETEECSIYVCDKCPKQFKQKLSFQRHLRTHSEEKLYTCIHCPKRFARSGGLSRHMLTHTLEKPFVCPVCGKACTQMSNMRSHMQTHKDSGLLYCSLCGMAFSDRSTHQEHLKNAHVFDRISSGKSCATSDAISTIS